MILFNDFNRQPRFLRKEINTAVQRVLNSGRFILGKELETFELSFANYIGSLYCVGVASGTEAIALALMAMDIGRGDEVITTNMTAFPTISGILQSGARPVVVDIDSATGLIDYRQIQAKITQKTRAIIPVHLYGQCCNMIELMQMAAMNNLFVIEDCAQSAGAAFDGIRCGAMGNCGAFSFYPTKNLGTCGDAGAVTTSDPVIYNKLKALRNYGQTERYYHDSSGINSRMDEIQAAILNVKLKYLDEWNTERQRIAFVYRENLQTVKCLKLEDYGEHVNHLFVIKSSQRDKLQQYLQENGIQTFIHYPVPVNRQKAFPMYDQEYFPESVQFANEILSLPIYPGLSKKDNQYIIKTINEFKS